MPKLQLPPSEEKTPVTIITGFLGSGKSTLLNHVLKWSQAQQDGGMVVGSKGELLGRESRRLKNIAVIENEFGEVSIDKHIGECCAALCCVCEGEGESAVRLSHSVGQRRRVARKPLTHAYSHTHPAHRSRSPHTHDTHSG